ncbi:unnamed protein product, partial [Owenia fusiformis]
IGKCSTEHDDHLEAWVSCKSELFSDPNLNNQIRLKDGSSGQLQVKDSLGEWFPVCGIYWTKGASQVVCKQLGFKAQFGFTLKSYKIDNYMDYNRQIITNINCNGTEKSLRKCSYTKWTALYGSASTWHKERALECGSNGIQISCVDTSMRPRLIGGQSNTTGQLEVWYKKTWNKVCIGERESIYSYRSKRLAESTCFTLGYNNSKVGTYGSFNQEKKQDRMTKGISLLCEEYDALQMCNVTRAHCDDYNMYFISCFDQEPELTNFVDFEGQESDFRHYALADGVLKIDVPDKSSYDNFYICSTGWSVSEAKVACRQQGFDPKDAAIDTFSKYPC